MRKASCIGALLLALVASPALAQAPFYQGKQIKIIVGFSPVAAPTSMAASSRTGLPATSRVSPASWCSTCPAPAASSP